MTPTTEELTRVGSDGIRRSLDEHYDTMMDVHQDPTGAHIAIQALAARVVALEEVVKAADAMRESVIYGYDPFQSLRDLDRYEATRAKLEERG